MSLECDRSALVDLGPVRSVFEAVRELRGRAGDGRPRHGRELLEAARFACRDGVVVKGHECSTCKHFLNMRPDPDGLDVTIRCVFYESDPVTAIMAAPERIAVVAHDAAAAEVVQAAYDLRVEVVALVKDGRIVGTVKASAASRSPAAAAATLARPPVAVAPDTAVGVAAQVLAARGADALLVCDGEQVLGMITPRDLARAGIHGE